MIQFRGENETLDCLIKSYLGFEGLKAYSKIHSDVNKTIKFHVYFVFLYRQTDT